MAEEKLNRRRAYSRMVIRRAFLELLETKPLSKLTVREVCERADVNRTTFYANYTDLYGLMDSISDELLNAVKVSVESASGMTDYEAILREVFRAINDNMDICRVVFSTPDSDFIRRVVDIAYELTLKEWHTRLQPKSRERFDYLFEFQASGCIGIIKKWISEGAKQPWQSVADHAIQFTLKYLELF